VELAGSLHHGGIGFFVGGVVVRKLLLLGKWGAWRSDVISGKGGPWRRFLQRMNNLTSLNRLNNKPSTPFVKAAS